MVGGQRMFGELSDLFTSKWCFGTSRLRNGCVGQTSHSTACAIHVVFLTLMLTRCTEVGSVPVISDDVMALLVFKADIIDHRSYLSSWSDNGSSPCSWFGIRCNPITGRVTDISLIGLSLSGQIGRALVKLEQLQTINLAQNNFSGSINGEIAQISELRSLNLSNNALTGDIPSSLGSAGNLETLDLSINALSGMLPPELFSYNCQSLRVISVSSNMITGPIPASVGSCMELTSLNFSDNQLSGKIPDGIWALDRVQNVDLSCNFLSGQIPIGVGFLKNLTNLRLQSNNFSGEVPAELGNCVLLETLVLSENSFSGLLPVQLANLEPLAVFDVAGNFFSGNIPTWLGNMTSLQQIILADNQFEGQMPSYLGRLQQLFYIDLGGNNLTGVIPDEIFALENLEFLHLSRNFLTGEVPLFPLNGCQNLKTLDLSRNQLSGALPAQTVACSNLRFLSVGGNTLSSTVPPELSALRLLEFLDLSSNSFIGNIPSSLGNASNLSTLYLQGNALNGSIPGELGNCSSLINLNLSLNNLSGEIPADLGQLVYLQYLDLSHNKISGKIPAQLGQLQNLQLINVSYNDLEGPVPTSGVFAHLNSTAVAQNNGLCGPILNLSCSPFPDSPVVMNPDDDGSRPGTLSPLLRSKRSQIVLSVSAITAISAAAAIALGVILVTLLNMYAQTRRRSNIFVVDSDPQSPSTAEMALGKLVMFTRHMEPKSDDWMASAHAILNKDCEIGRGGFGTVFKAVLAHGETVAVKKLMVSSLVKSQHEFEKVVHTLGKVKHPNLVTLQGYYWTEQLQLLIYDYVSNGNLYSQLHERREDEPPLAWRMRFKIALGTALGLAHLHHGNSPQLIHYDVKSSNILLDDEYEARLSDYSLAKFLPKLDTYVMSSKMQSALGYMAPEFACQSLKITEKCDVYGFGVLLLELVTGRRPVEYMEDDVVILCDYVRALLDEGRALTCVDSKLRSFPEDEVLPIIKLGLICTSQVPSNRPSMAEVVQILELIRPLVESRGGS